jgi:hypothetical protein
LINRHDYGLLITRNDYGLLLLGFILTGTPTSHDLFDRQETVEISRFLQILRAGFKHGFSSVDHTITNLSPVKVFIFFVLGPQLHPECSIVLTNELRKHTGRNKVAGSHESHPADISEGV